MQQLKTSDYIFVSAFVAALASYLLWQPIEVALDISPNNEGMVFYVGISITFYLYALAYEQCSTGAFKYFTRFVCSIILLRVFRETFNPEDAQKYDPFEFINIPITAFFVWVYVLFPNLKSKISKIFKS